MNISDNSSYMDMYENDDNSICDDEYLSPEIHRDISMVLLVLYYMLFFFSLIGNTTVLWVLLHAIKVRTVTDICLLNLTLSDLILAVTLPLWAYNSQSLALCKLMTGVYQLGFYSATMFVTLMSVDRYLAIVHAVAAIKTRTLCYGIAASITIWVLSVIMATPQVIFANLEIDPEDNSSQCHPLYPEETHEFWKMQRNFSENTVGLFLCLPILIFCYVKILLVLSKTRYSKKDRAVRLIFTIVGVFVLCWVPYNVTVFLQTLQLFDTLRSCEAAKNIDSALSFAEIIALSHCCVNPVIYAFVGEKFSKSLRNVLRRDLCYCHPGSLSSTLRDTTGRDTSNTPAKSDF